MIHQVNIKLINNYLITFLIHSIQNVIKLFLYSKTIFFWIILKFKIFFFFLDENEVILKK